MNRKVGLGLVALVIVGVLVFALLGTNLLRSEGVAEFGSGENGLNTLRLTGPYGWKCMEYSTADNADGTVELLGTSKGDCSLLGPVELTSTDYPDRGSVAVPLDTPTLVHQNADKTHKLYVLITKDASALDKLGS